MIKRMKMSELVIENTIIIESNMLRNLFFIILNKVLTNWK